MIDEILVARDAEIEGVPFFSVAYEAYKRNILIVQNMGSDIFATSEDYKNFLHKKGNGYGDGEGDGWGTGRGSGHETTGGCGYERVDGSGHGEGSGYGYLGGSGHGCQE